MAGLHASIEAGNSKTVSRYSNTIAKSMLETWEVRIVTLLEASGKYTITVMDRNTSEVIQVISGKYPEESSNNGKKSKKVVQSGN